MVLSLAAVAALAAAVLGWTVRRGWSAAAPEVTEIDGGVQLRPARPLRLRLGATALLLAAACGLLAYVMFLDHDPTPRRGGWLAVGVGALLFAAYAVDLLRHGTGRLRLSPDGLEVRPPLSRTRTVAWRHVRGVQPGRRGLVLVATHEGKELRVAPVQGWTDGRTERLIAYLAGHSLARADLRSADGLRRWSDHVS